VFKTEAFCVSCAAEGNGHLFCDDSVWPEGAELRDWYFKRRSKATDRSNTTPNQ